MIPRFRSRRPTYSRRVATSSRRSGGSHLDAAGYDWLGILTGSEGRFAVTPEVTARILRVGDGDLHPLILFDANDPESMAKAEKFGADILKLCVASGGCLTGEHGVGIEKRELVGVQFSNAELAQQKRVKSVFDPEWLLNPSKAFPLRPAPAIVAV